MTSKESILSCSADSLLLILAGMLPSVASNEFNGEELLEKEVTDPFTANSERTNIAVKTETMKKDVTLYRNK